MKKINKSYVIRLFIWMVVCSLAFSFLDFEPREFTTGHKISIWAWSIGSLFLFAILFPFEAEKVARSPRIVELKKKNLKWSPLMSNCSWEQVQEIIQNRGKCWRFPTIEEFENRPYFFPHNFRYWLADQRLYSLSFNKEVVATRNVKAHLYLVREI